MFVKDFDISVISEQLLWIILVRHTIHYTPGCNNTGLIGYSRPICPYFTDIAG